MKFTDYADSHMRSNDALPKIRSWTMTEMLNLSCSVVTRTHRRCILIDLIERGEFA